MLVVSLPSLLTLGHVLHVVSVGHSGPRHGRLEPGRPPRGGPRRDGPPAAETSGGTAEETRGGDAERQSRFTRVP